MEKQKTPKVTEASLKRKIIEGVYMNGWNIVGVGGTHKAMMKPLIDYLKSKGVDVA